MVPWVEWLNRTTGGQSVQEICTTIGSNPSTFNRWKQMVKPPCEAIIDLAVAYKGDVIVGLVVAGYLPREYVAASVEDRLKHVPAVFLTNELARRDSAGELTPAVRPEWE